jgi:predicted ATPase
MLTRAEIRGFKCLHDVSVEFGLFNVLNGPNDSGKSSFLQAVGEPQKHHRMGQERMARMGSGNRSVRLWTADSDLYVGYAPDGRVRFSEPLMLEPMEIAALSPRGSGNLATLIQSRGRGATAHLARVALGDRDRYEAIQKGMRDITSGRIREAIVGEDTGQGYPLTFRLLDNKVIPAAEVSQGLLLYFAFLTIVHRDDAPAVLLIEEPENGVHPLRLHEVIRLLRTLTERGVQIILTTHSPDLLNACKPEEILVFRRPQPDSGTEIHRLPLDFERRAMRSTMGEIWASTGEEGLLDILPTVEPLVRAEVG